MRSARPDSSGASERERRHPLPLSPGLGKERGGGRPRLRGPHSAARGGLALLFGAVPALSLSLSVSLSVSLSALASLSVPILVSVCFSVSGFVLSLSLCFGRSLPPDPSLLLPVHLCACPSVSGPQRRRSARWPVPEQRAGRPEAGEGAGRAGAQRPPRASKGRVVSRPRAWGGARGAGTGGTPGHCVGRSLGEGDAPRCLPLNTTICRFAAT